MKTREELIEVMARAMWNDTNEGSWPDHASPDQIAIYRSNAVATLTAIEAVGCVVVPKVATEEMLEMVAWRDEYAPDQGDYQGMLSASPYRPR